MKFLFVTDSHTAGRGPSSRKDSYTGALKNKLREVAQAAQDENVEAVLHGGDLFDTPVVSETLKGEIAEIIRSSGKPWYVVPGNHDLFGYNISSLPQTSLGLLEKTGVLTVLSRSFGPLVFTDSGETVSFEGQEYHKDIDHQAVALDYFVAADADYKVLIPHSMLLDKEYFPEVPYTNVSQLSGQTSADLILVGHYHDGYPTAKFTNKEGKKAFVENPGSMIRDEASKGNLTRIPGYMILTWDQGQMTRERRSFSNVAPGVDIFDRSHIDDKNTKLRYLDSFERKLSDDKLSAVDVRSVLDAIYKKSKSVDEEMYNLAAARLVDAEEVRADVSDKMKGYIEKKDNISITDLNIKGFQSHEDTRIQFGSGLNAIVGPSDSGKSAIVRALRFVLYNDPRGTDFIRQGLEDVSVEVEFSDGSAIKRARSRTSAGTYVVRDDVGNTNEYKGFSNNIPVDVANAHQMPHIRLSKDMEAALNVGYQLDAPFLIGSSPGVRAAIIGKLTGVDLVDHALKSVGSDILANTRQIKEDDEQLTEYDERLKDYEDLPALKETIDAAGIMLADIDKLTQTLDKLESLQASWASSAQVIGQLKIDLANVNRISNLGSAIAALESNKSNLESLVRLETAHSNSTSVIETAESTLKEQTRIASLKTDIDVLRLKHEYKLALEAEHALKEALDNVGVVTLENTEVLEDRIATYRALERHATSLNRADSFMFDLTKEIDAARAEGSNAEEMYRRLLEEHGTCPTCSQVIETTEHIHL